MSIFVFSIKKTNMAFQEKSSLFAWKRFKLSIIKAVDKEDPKPLWVTAWGGPNVLAQALWKIKRTRSKEEVQNKQKIWHYKK